MSFANIYFKRVCQIHPYQKQATTQKTCYICSRATSTVLATTGSIDFFYICDGHLTDPGFASQMILNAEQAAAARKAGMSDQEYLTVLKTKAEYEDKLKKKEKEKEKKEKEKKEQDGKEKDEKKDEKEKEVKQPSQSSSSLSTPSPAPSAPASLSHQRYELHRDIFAMRQNIHKKRRQAAQAKEIAPRLPAAPRSTPSTSLNPLP